MSPNISYGNLVLSSVRACASILIVVLIGVVMVRFRRLTPSAGRDVSALVLTVVMPSMLFVFIGSSLASGGSDGVALMLLGSTLHVFVIGVIVGCGLAKLFRLPLYAYPVVMLPISIQNSGFVPLSLVTALGFYPPFNQTMTNQGLSNISAYMGFHTVFLWSAGLLLLSLAVERKKAALLLPSATSLPPPSNDGNSAAASSLLPPFILPMSSPTSNGSSSTSSSSAAYPNHHDDGGGTLKAQSAPIFPLSFFFSSFSGRPLFTPETKVVLKKVGQKLASNPPLLSVVLGLVFGGVPILRNLFFSVGGQSPVFGLLSDILLQLSAATLPLANMMLGITFASSVLMQQGSSGKQKATPPPPPQPPPPQPTSSTDTKEVSHEEVAAASAAALVLDDSAASGSLQHVDPVEEIISSRLFVVCFVIARQLVMPFLSLLFHYLFISIGLYSMPKDAVTAFVLIVEAASPSALVIMPMFDEMDYYKGPTSRMILATYVFALVALPFVLATTMTLMF